MKTFNRVKSVVKYRGSIHKWWIRELYGGITNEQVNESFFFRERGARKWEAHALTKVNGLRTPLEPNL